MTSKPVWHDLGTPSPRDAVAPYEPIHWPAAQAVRLPFEVPAAQPGVTLALARRRSCRHFAPTARSDILAALGTLLGSTCGVVRGPSIDVAGTNLSQRPAPSAGAIHPVHVVLNMPDDDAWHRYDPFEHQLVELRGASATEARREAADIFAAPDACLLLFAAEPGLTGAKYSEADSLVWRDAGALQGLLCLAAEALGLGSCLLGSTGDRHARSLTERSGLHGAGMAYIGCRAG